MGVGLEEVEQLFGDFLSARVAGMGAISPQIAALPDKPVTLARCGPVGPEVGAPEQQRRFPVAPFGNAVKYFESGKNWGFTNWRNMK